jgi:hypothetical protein
VSQFISQTNHKKAQNSLSSLNSVLPSWREKTGLGIDMGAEGFGVGAGNEIRILSSNGLGKPFIEANYHRMLQHENASSESKQAKKCKRASAPTDLGSA